jgi:2-dehydropantoate 2-reductase
MKIAVIGAGAIGSLIAGYLKQKDKDIILVGHAEAAKKIKEDGLDISGVRGNYKIRIDALEKLTSQPDLAIITTKTQDIVGALEENKGFLSDSLVLTTQNGVQADNIVAGFIPSQNIISSIVMFGATLKEPAKAVHNFEGNWIIGRIFGKNDEKVFEISKLLNEIFPTVVAEGIKGMKYLKIFVNANNCLAAILGKSMQETFADIRIASISIAIWREGLDIIKETAINLVSLPDFPVERVIKLTSLPNNEAAKIFSQIMTALSKEPLYGSILQSIQRNRPSEIDYINGEFVRLAQEYKSQAPLNKKLVEMVYEVQRTKLFFTKEQLLAEVKDCL